MRLLQRRRQFRHGDVGLRLNACDQKTHDRRELASSRRATLRHRRSCACPQNMRREPHRKTRAHPKPARRVTTRATRRHMSPNPIPKILRIRLAHDPPPRRMNHRPNPQGIPDDSGQSHDALGVDGGADETGIEPSLGWSSTFAPALGGPEYGMTAFGMISAIARKCRRRLCLDRRARVADPLPC